MNKHWINKILIDKHWISLGIAIRNGKDLLYGYRTYQRILEIHLFLLHIRLGYLVEKGEIDVKD